ncbi:MAG TPA: DUF6294 family protein [Actinophytocola sp.]|uniref:DUF6294 family protein n=1 Tax=Actinophytocola sp. TaxID=1872138 RepID=UPI002DDD08E2|nr:DUF6294 family protein [Actinophytocola sp.]HEV2782534.1 DUF6294 family protein [Actinophytocola sp.]
MNRSVIREVANVSAVHLTGWEPWEFTWGLIRSGDCTMFEGATWTLFPNGVAMFDGTVSSGDDDDAWVIWHVDLLDRNRAILGSLANEHPTGGDWRKFVRTMPSSAERYRFRALATFDPGLWGDIDRLKMHWSC